MEGLAAGTPAPLLRAAPAVLEDMAVAVADAVAAAYLSEAGFGLDGARGDLGFRFLGVRLADAVAATYLSEAGFGLDGARGDFSV